MRLFFFFFFFGIVVGFLVVGCLEKGWRVLMR